MVLVALVVQIIKNCSHMTVTCIPTNNFSFSFELGISIFDGFIIVLDVYVLHVQLYKLMWLGIVSKVVLGYFMAASEIMDCIIGVNNAYVAKCRN